MKCPICAEPTTPTTVHAYDRLATGDGPFTVVECRACEFGLTIPQLSEEELGPYYAESYYEGYYEHSGKGGGNRLLMGLRDRVRERAAARRYASPPFRFEGIEPGREIGRASCRERV